MRPLLLPGPAPTQSELAPGQRSEEPRPTTARHACSDLRGAWTPAAVCGRAYQAGAGTQPGGCLCGPLLCPEAPPVHPTEQRCPLVSVDGSIRHPPPRTLGKGLEDGPPLRFEVQASPTRPQPSQGCPSGLPPHSSVRPCTWPRPGHPLPDPLFPSGHWAPQQQPWSMEHPPCAQTSLLTLFQGLEETTEPGPGPQGRARSSPGPDQSRGWLMAQGWNPGSPTPAWPRPRLHDHVQTAHLHPDGLRQAEVMSSCE